MKKASIMVIIALAAAGFSRSGLSQTTGNGTSTTGNGVFSTSNGNGTSTTGNGTSNNGNGTTTGNGTFNNGNGTTTTGNGVFTTANGVFTTGNGAFTSGTGTAITTANGANTTGNGAINGTSNNGNGTINGTFGTQVNTANGTSNNGNGTTTGITANNGTVNGTTTGNGAFNRSDIRWLNQAAAGSLQEITLGNLAQTNSSNTNVQAFGALLVQDHTLAFQQAQALGATNSVNVPTTITTAQQRNITRLSRLTGTNNFDAAFLNLMVRDHIADIQSYETEAQRGANADVRAYARAQLPILMNHLVIALDLQDALGLRNVR